MIVLFSAFVFYIVDPTNGFVVMLIYLMLGLFWPLFLVTIILAIISLLTIKVAVVIQDYQEKSAIERI